MNALTIIFVAIFVATAILTLASLPGWIKIPEGYRKALFTALILEVVGCVILMFNDSQKPKFEFNEQNWVALKTNGELIDLKVNDSLIGLSKEKFSKYVKENTSPKFRLEFDAINKNHFFVKKGESYIGAIDQAGFKESGFFNSIDPWGSGFEQVEFRLNDAGKWICNHKFPIWEEDLTISLTDTGYVISDKALTKIYANKRSFNSDDRTLHFVQPNEEFCYLIRISSANLIAENKFVNFFIIRFKPSFEENNR